MSSRYMCPTCGRIVTEPIRGQRCSFCQRGGEPAGAAPHGSRLAPLPAAGYVSPSPTRAGRLTAAAPGLRRATLDLMRDGEFRTLREVAAVLGCSEPTASARIRDMRKGRYGSHEVRRRNRGPASCRLYEYGLTLNPFHKESKP